MDSKEDNLNGLVNTVANDEIEQVIEEENDDHNNVAQNLNIKTEAIDINSKESRKIQNATCNIKDFNDSSIDIVTFLKAEFSGLGTQNTNKNIQEDKVTLPKYTTIDLKINHSKKHKKDRKRMYTKNRLGLFWKEPIVVQFMGSEKCSEEREVTEYEPETGNDTVRAMFAVLLVLHIFTLFITFGLFVSDMSRNIFMRYGLAMWIPPFILYVALIIFAACTKHVRTASGVNIIMAWTLILLILTLCPLFGSYTLYRYALFIYAYASMIVTDIVFIFIGYMSSFDFRSRIVYVIGICTSLLVDAILSYARSIVYYGPPLFYNWRSELTLAYYMTPFYTLLLIIPAIAELQHLLSGEWIELGENDYHFGAYLMFVGTIDYPIRMMRKAGLLKMCDTASGDDE